MCIEGRSQEEIMTMGAGHHAMKAVISEKNGVDSSMG
jgi:hypothetical protein